LDEKLSGKLKWLVSVVVSLRTSGQRPRDMTASVLHGTLSLRALLDVEKPILETSIEGANQALSMLTEIIDQLD
jgi:hypothetical protein